MKAHICMNDAPTLKEGQSYVALCGKSIMHATFVFWFDFDATKLFDSLNRLNTCEHCLAQPITEKYVYGMVNAQSLIEDRQREEFNAA